MRHIAILIIIILNGFSRLNAQSIKVAILDFENTSGISKYDGLGKAMSSMLITDIEANVSPKRLQLVERAQIQKILKEQNFQASAAVDKSSSVKAGKLFGVKYLLVGDIYILNDILVINARLTDTETGDIKFSKKQEGKITGWLTLKTNIAKDLATSLSQPFIEPTIPDKEVNVATLTTFGNALAAQDDGKLERAEELINTVNEFSPDFKYLDDLKKEINILKEQLNAQSQKIEVLEKSGGRIVNPQNFDDYLHNLNLNDYKEEDYREIFIKFSNKITQAQIESLFYGPKCFFVTSYDYKIKLEAYKHQIGFLNTLFYVVDDTVLVKYCLPKTLEFLETISDEYGLVWSFDIVENSELEGLLKVTMSTKKRLLEEITRLDIAGFDFIKLLSTKKIISEEFVKLVYEHSLFKYSYTVTLRELLKQQNFAIDSLKQVLAGLKNEEIQKGYQPELANSITETESLIRNYKFNTLHLYIVKNYSGHYEIPRELCDYISANENYFNSLKFNNYLIENNKICLNEFQQINFKSTYQNRVNFKNYFYSSLLYPENYKESFVNYKPKSLELRSKTSYYLRNIFTK
jgi:TolB-like protein